jgi:16S rRNA (adenine1518-N6/adenine1519-N6)-dimethyltransferase
VTGKHRARKRFGQNFLHDQGIIRQIIRSIAPQPSDHLVEIGPGQGALTGGLVSSGCQLDIVELDRDLVPFLQAEFGATQGLNIHSADALEFNFGQLCADEKKLRIVGNLPYNISTPLIFHLLTFAPQIVDMHFMLQLEVVNRLAATPGNKAWGRLGVMTQYHCRIDALFEVPPSAFHPEPKVQSAIVRLVPHAKAPTDPGQQQRLQRVVTAAFSQRRKTLRNTLRDLISVQQLESLGIDPGARAETLDLQQFIALSDLPGDSQG